MDRPLGQLLLGCPVEPHLGGRADLELATAELRVLRAERNQLKTATARLRETEAERDRLREALKETEEKLEATLKSTISGHTDQPHPPSFS